MKKIIAALIAVMAIVGIAPPASAGRLEYSSVCVRADFTQTGSGWKVQGAVNWWNEYSPMGTLVLDTTVEAGCSLVAVHRYNNPASTWCGYTENYGFMADVYLNDNCLSQGSYMAKRIIAHELGHALGLPDNTSTRSVMNYGSTVEIGVNPVKPVDAQGVAILYATR